MTIANAGKPAPEEKPASDDETKARHGGGESQAGAGRLPHRCPAEGKR